MSKLSKLFAIGTGIAVANYYSKNPNKVEEHAEYVKRKSKDYYGYTRCMIRYTKKNGVEEAAIYLYNDLVKNLKKAKDALENKYNDAVDYGKELSTNITDIKEHVSNVKEYTAEVKENLGEAKKIVEDFKPSVESYKEKAMASFDKIKDQVSNIKKDIDASNVQEKVEDFANKSSETLDTVKERVETEVLNNTTEQEEEK
ncbi:hypothetical protein [uncultured Gemella sp.]|uniref:hypothetical protein n=1 Tax=uncultured Gemella sp. TaxID=254352 RepID=UPI0028D7C10A|nr:hypothetical protein [uncultured Gemella sp.]